MLRRWARGHGLEAGLGTGRSTTVLVCARERGGYCVAQRLLQRAQRGMVPRTALEGVNVPCRLTVAGGLVLGTSHRFGAARAPRTTFMAGLPGMGWLLPPPKPPPKESKPLGIRLVYHPSVLPCPAPSKVKIHEPLGSNHHPSLGSPCWIFVFCYPCPDCGGVGWGGGDDRQSHGHDEHPVCITPLVY